MTKSLFTVDEFALAEFDEVHDPLAAHGAVDAAVGR